MPLSDPKLTLGVPEVSTYTGLSQTTLWRAIKDGRLPVIREGGRTLIAVADLVARYERASAK